MSYTDQDALEHVRQIVTEYAEKDEASIPTHVLINALGGY